MVSHYMGIIHRRVLSDHHADLIPDGIVQTRQYATSAGAERGRMQLRRVIAVTTAYCDEHGWLCVCVTIRESTTIREKKCKVVGLLATHIGTRLTLTHCTPASLLLTGRTYIHHYLTRIVLAEIDTPEVVPFVTIPALNHRGSIINSTTRAKQQLLLLLLCPHISSRSFRDGLLLTL